jgi:hypothetical protein
MTLPANNISYTHRFRNGRMHNWVALNAQCQCHSDEHQHKLIIEYDNEFDLLSLTLYFKTWTPNYWNHQTGFFGWFKDVWASVKFRLECVFKGYNTLSYDFIFNGEEAIQDYIDALQASLNQIKQVKMEAQQKRSNRSDKQQ